MNDATARLRDAGVHGAGRDACVLLEHVVGCSLASLSEASYYSLPARLQHAFENAVVQRTARKPVSQITGQREFFGRRFKVTSDVLDPRPDSESLVLLALSKNFRCILDVGTGSGCLLVSILAERSAAIGAGVDICEKALAVARQNAERNGVSSRCDFRHSNWFSTIDRKFDLIISNPPYIDRYECASLAPEIRLYEPRHALTLGGDGTEAFRILASKAKNHLYPGGCLIVEIGSKQFEPVKGIFAGHGFDLDQVKRDLDGNIRALSLVPRP